MLKEIAVESPEAGSSRVGAIIGGGNGNGGGGGGERKRFCAGCCQDIEDRFYLLAVDRVWHQSCLRCHQCMIPLHSHVTCYSRHGFIYCKQDYYRLFAEKKCARCSMSVAPYEFVMKARQDVYHMRCFTCAFCEIKLSKGDHFGMRDGYVYCRLHYEELRHRDYLGLVETGPLWYQYGEYLGGNFASKGRTSKKMVVKQEASDRIDLGDEAADFCLLKMPRFLPGGQNDRSEQEQSSMESGAYDSSSGANSPATTSMSTMTLLQPGMQRNKRMRTSFKHHQLRTMKSYFNINQNPDAKDLKQLAQKTGLSKRVLQVWFQNARAKWRRNTTRRENNNNLAILSHRLPHHLPLQLHLQNPEGNFNVTEFSCKRF